MVQARCVQSFVCLTGILFTRRADTCMYMHIYIYMYMYMYMHMYDFVNLSVALHVGCVV